MCSFYDKVKALCREHGISITRMAENLGFSKTTPTWWKGLKTPPRAETVKKVADYFKVPISYFDEESESALPPKGKFGCSGDKSLTLDMENIGEIERELLVICSKLDMKKKTALL